MILCFDIGNTDIYGGVFAGGKLQAEFRRANRQRPCADEFGVFLLQVLQARGVDPAGIHDAALASVVPDCDDSVVDACRTYLGIEPLVLRSGVRTGLKIRYRNPAEVGADRIANAIAAVHLYPGRNLIVIDMGTATTFCAISAERDYLGGVIAAGMGLSMRALAEGTAKLPHVDLVKPAGVLGRSTVESIQNGLYHGHLGLVRTVVAGLRAEVFGGDQALVIGTGGHARFFIDAGIFDTYEPNLVLLGLCRAVELNRSDA
jgi:type III pantothenate kinase